MQPARLSVARSQPAAFAAATSAQSHLQAAPGRGVRYWVSSGASGWDGIGVERQRRVGNAEISRRPAKIDKGIQVMDIPCRCQD